MNQTEQLRGATAPFSEMKILIIDDELANVALLEDILAGSGYTQVRSIMDPRLTMQTCAEFEPDVVLLDLRMPHMDGFAVLEVLRANSTGAFLPVIVLTADIDAQSKYRALRAGATDYLLKPFDHLEVLLRMGLFMERRRIEYELHHQKTKAEAASAAKDRFLAMASHELRAPLTPVLLWASGTVQEPDLSPDLQDGLQMVCRNVQLEARMIDDMLDLTRITRGKFSLHRRRTDAHQLIGQALDIVRSEIEARHLNLCLGLDAREDRVRVDPTRLQQVFWNVLRNACKFTPERGTICVRSFNELDTICIEISDSGVGLEPCSVERIFEPFEQVDSKQEGLGLGLAISNAIMKMHGGSICARSDGLGQGTTFSITITVDTAAER
jgi:signal transduction histidine kinase